MAVVVSLVGAAIVALGLAGVAAPARLVGLLTRWRAPERRWTAVGVRLVLGVVFLIAAPECRLPRVAQAVGVLAIISALVLVLMGPRRFTAFIGWWVDQPPAVLRIWFAGAAAFGALCAYAGA